MQASAHIYKNRKAYVQRNTKRKANVHLNTLQSYEFIT